jgi:hypothetical protein
MGRFKIRLLQGVLVMASSQMTLQAGDTIAVWNKLRRAMFTKEASALTEALVEAELVGGISPNLMNDARELLRKFKPEVTDHT